MFVFVQAWSYSSNVHLRSASAEGGLSVSRGVMMSRSCWLLALLVVASDGLFVLKTGELHAEGDVIGYELVDHGWRVVLLYRGHTRVGGVDLPEASA